MSERPHVMAFTSKGYADGGARHIPAERRVEQRRDGLHSLGAHIIVDNDARTGTDRRRISGSKEGK